MPNLLAVEETHWQTGQHAIQQEFLRCDHAGAPCIDCLREALDHAAYEIARLRAEIIVSRKGLRRALKDASSLGDLKLSAGVRPRRSYKLPQIRRCVEAVLAGGSVKGVARREGVPKATLAGWVASARAEAAQRPMQQVLRAV